MKPLPASGHFDTARKALKTPSIGNYSGGNPRATVYGPIKDGEILFSNLGYGDAGDHVEIPAGTYELKTRLAGVGWTLETTSLTARLNEVYSVFPIGLRDNLEL